MSCTVFANSNGFFHKGSSGSGIAFPDVCLSPPPPPAGPIPIPYPNTVSAGDLTKGSKTVKIDGEPTALQDSSEISTSTGDEGGTQGGNVLTHKTKGKGVAMFWSLTVLVEGKNAVRHGDPMAQNCATPPFGGLDTRLSVVKNALKSANAPAKDCPKRYSKAARHGSPTKDQKDHVNQKPPPPTCWECGKTSTQRMVADHQPPVVVKFYAGGCHEESKPQAQNTHRAWARSKAAVKPHCRSCSSSQGGKMSALSQKLATVHGL
jgi:uncharacterized Zn-binding protein involved in type VI secretion